MNAPTVRTLVPSGMHRVATRLGIRDGEAYTVVTGLVLALLLAVLGLPGVFRGFDATGFGPVAAAQPAGVDATPDAGEGQVAPAPTVTAPSVPPLAGLPATSPSPLQGSGGGDADPVAPPADSAPPPSIAPGRPAGDFLPFTELAAASAPDGIAVGPDGTVYVTTDDVGAEASTLHAFDADGTPIGSWDAPDQPVARTRGLTGVAVGPGDTVFVVDAATSRILLLDRSADALVMAATVPDVPACGLLNLASPCEPGLLSNPPSLEAIAVSTDGAFAVADRGQGIVWSVEGDSVRLLASFVDRLAGEGPVGLSFLYDGGLVVVNSGRLATLPIGLPAVFRIRPDEDAPEHVIDLGIGEIPGDVVAGDSGRVYVTIPTLGLVADIGLDHLDRIDIDVTTTDPTFRTPTGAALRDGALLLSDHLSRVVDLAVLDRPVT